MYVLLIRLADNVDGALTAHGEQQARGLADRLRWYDCAPERMWTTPTGIATADVIAATLTHPPHVEAIHWLAHDNAAARIRAIATSLIAICADEPTLSTLATRLLAAPFAPLSRAHAARIVDGRLRWRFAWNADASEPCTPRTV